MAQHRQPFTLISLDDYKCTLTEDSLEKARKELNEDPQERLNAVRQLKEWIQQQPHITFDADAVFLLAFLRTAKFSQLRARKMIDGFVTVFHTHKAWFHNIDTHDPRIQAVLGTGAILPLPKRTKDGQNVVLLRMGKIDVKSKEYNFHDEIRANYIMGSYTGRDENTIVNGTVFIVDCTGMSLKHVTRSNNDEMRKWYKVIQNNFPGRYKAFHYYNAGKLFDGIMAIVKPFLSKKFQDRIAVHHTAESLYKAIGMEVLPMDYLPDDYKGPTIGSCEEITANFQKTVRKEDYRKFLIWGTSTSSAHCNLDESKRLQDIPQEAFRKLNVD